MEELTFGQSFRTKKPHTAKSTKNFPTTGSKASPHISISPFLHLPSHTPASLSVSVSIVPCLIKLLRVGLSQARQLVSAVYHKEVNKYGVKCGGDLDMWESSGWISPIDPYGEYASSLPSLSNFSIPQRQKIITKLLHQNFPSPKGWFQWYCRFYLGRRCSDDVRQIARWRGVCGPTGRFKRQLLNKIRNTSGTWTDSAVSPVIRQTLLHWSYEITEEEYKAFCKEKA